jgi:hypothetical protein
MDGLKLADPDSRIIFLPPVFFTLLSGVKQRNYTFFGPGEQAFLEPFL